MLRACLGAALIATLSLSVCSIAIATPVEYGSCFALTASDGSPAEG